MSRSISVGFSRLYQCSPMFCWSRSRETSGGELRGPAVSQNSFSDIRLPQTPHFLLDLLQYLTRPDQRHHRGVISVQRPVNLQVIDVPAHDLARFLHAAPKA